MCLLSKGWRITAAHSKKKVYNCRLDIGEFVNKELLGFSTVAVSRIVSGDIICMHE
jgi:hypothetical protein